MTAMMLFSSFVVLSDTTIRITVLVAGAVGGVVVWFFVPNAEEKDIISPELADTISKNRNIAEEAKIQEEARKTKL